MKTAQTFPHADNFAALNDGAAVYLCPQSVARLQAAAQGIQALTAILVQREAESEGMDADVPRTFGPGVALGILSALSCCAEVVQGAADGRILPTAERLPAGRRA